MTLRDSLTLIGAALLALGPEMQIEGATPLEWRIGRYARIVGVVLIGARGAMPDKTKPTKP